MADISFDRFEGGLDVRKSSTVSDANRLKVLTNAYITKGKAIRKRPCLSILTTLETGTIGLGASGGKLQTFYSGNAAIAHANTFFQANRVTHPSAVTPVTKLHFCSAFQGFPYIAVEYADGSVKHFYMDAPGAWTAAKTYALGAFVTPTVPNGYRYELTQCAVDTPVTMTIATPCVVTFTAHGMLAGDPIKLTTTGALPTGLVAGTTYYVLAPAANNFNLAATPGGAAIATSGTQSGVHTLTRQTGISSGTQPIWPLVVNTTIVDNPGVNQLTWTARPFNITDVNCPNSKQVIIQQSKVYAGNGDTVRYSATGLPRDWTSVSDAGFIAVGIQATGSATVTALGQFKRELAVFFVDSTQVWTADPNPALITIRSNVENIGTRYSKSPSAISGDLIFLSDSGFKSVSVIVLTDNLQDNDVGSPIDPLVSEEVLTTDDPVSVYYPELGQYWCVNGSNVYVYTISRSSRIAAWSRYTLPFAPDNVVNLNGVLYLRRGDTVYKMNKKLTNDYGSVPLVTIELPMLDCRSPGHLKQFWGMDIAMTGTANISFKFDSRDDTLVTSPIAIGSDTRPGALTPVEVCSTNIGPVITHQADEIFQLDFLQLYFQDLGPT